MLSQIFSFISPALAQDAAAGAAAAPSATASLMQYLPLIGLCVIWYALVIHPQKKKVDEQARMNKALQRGDRVVFSGGLHGKINKIEGDDILMIEIADNVVVKVDRGQVQGLEAKPQPVAAVDAAKS